MEYLSAVNVITVIIVSLILYFLRKLFTADIGENRLFYIMALIILGAGLYLWRSGAAAEIIGNISGTLK